MALDEPKDDDSVLDQNGYSILVDPQTRDVVGQSGGLTIDYVDEAHQKGYMLRLNQAAGGDCGSGGGGGCNGCG
jgi:Fe-S cluster assembly iron-binding protein IscA